jgi:hypothetical protein
LPFSPLLIAAAVLAFVLLSRLLTSRQQPAVVVEAVR